MTTSVGNPFAYCKVTNHHSIIHVYHALIIGNTNSKSQQSNLLSIQVFLSKNLSIETSSSVYEMYIDLYNHVYLYYK